jgi:hypothetical protein
MKVTRLVGWGLLAVILLWLPSAPHAFMSPMAPKVAYVKAYRVHNQQLVPIPVTRITHHELERVLNGIEQMAGLSSYQLPSRYLLFRFPSPVILPRSPIGYPIKEVIVTQPSSAWDPPRLLVRNTQRQWVEYRTSRPLTHLIHQLQRPGS